ncbi:MAG: outer membrane beta-barrel protein [Bacteroidota bacterium]|nr:outer membrane beta-barrel protein [Bacteroidota bacterium]MDP4213011.1 outer membrane beta-barrel protein [Bacteroidota bacterium]MDP4251164.1 outer membrane beta-barrel protein [Bacteroidota bacterium]
MMERIYFDNEFENQLKEKSDQLKMYPSDKVWNEVHRSLHTTRKRFVAGMSFLIGGILILAGTQLISPVRNTPHKQSATKPPVAAAAPATVDLHDFNPNAFSAADATNREPVIHNQRLRAPFISGPDDKASFVSAQNKYQSLEQLKSEIATVSNSTRSANVTLSSPSSGNKPSLSLNENELAQKLPEPADVSGIIPESEKSVTQLSHVRNDRFSWEIYVTPTLNTHHLYGVDYQNINSTIQNAPITVVRFANVNGFVDNTPAMGYDLGGNLLYRLSKNISLKAGLQFSFSRYYFKAYNSAPSQTSATLSSYYGYIADSLANYSLARTGSPKNPQPFQNKYYQLSVPVGIEWKIAGKGKLQVHLGATVQPSYLLNRNAYVLSSDYSNYSKDPEVYRRWNVQAGAETFISYRIGSIRWELGPQIRFQILSTYKNSYPLQENLVNYGIRLGFSKSIR